MIESVFGIIHSSKNYYLSKQQLDFAIKYVLDTKYNINPADFELRIDSINNITVFIFKENTRDDISMRIINEPYSYFKEYQIKLKILENIFNTKSIIEEVLYAGPFNNTINKIKFTVIEDFDDDDASPMSMQILNNPQIDMLNKQIKILNQKKLQLIKDNKR